MGKRPRGKCALCRRECELTFEHIPPRTAFNSTPVKPVSGDKIIKDDERMPWETSGLPYINQQQGMGRYSLCKECNNNTGAWYGNDYNLISHVMHHILSETISENINGIGIRKVYPLRFIKQVISMFCSINNFQDERMDNGTWKSMAVSEITAYTLGFILYFNPTDNWEYDGIDIIMKLYCEQVVPIYKQIKLLKMANSNLIAQRDLLLPRLMSEKLEV